MSKTQYSESSITVLKGLEPVKERPGMYTRTDSPTHICQEVIDNAADEALGGFATEIDVRIHDDGSLSVSDNGRGIPVGLHPVEGVPVVELEFTRLLRLVRRESDINLRACHHPEFDGWRWHQYWAPVDEVIDFKSDVYLGALKELSSRFLRGMESYEDFTARLPFDNR